MSASALARRVEIYALDLLDDAPVAPLLPPALDPAEKALLDAWLDARAAEARACYDADTDEHVPRSREVWPAQIEVAS